MPFAMAKKKKKLSRVKFGKHVVFLQMYKNGQKILIKRRSKWKTI